MCHVDVDVDVDADVDVDVDVMQHIINMYTSSTTSTSMSFTHPRYICA